MAHAMAFQKSRLVLSGLDLGLYALLEEGPRTADDIRQRLGLAERGVGDFLTALVHLGIIEEESGLFRNSPGASMTLTEDGAAGMTSFLRMVSRVMFPAWGHLTEALRTGQPQASNFHSDDMFSDIYSSEDTKDDLVRMAEDASRPLVPAIADAFDWGAYGSVVELGGCRGNVLAGLVAIHDHLDACVFDLPQLEPSFDDHMPRLGTTGKVRFHAGDFFTTPIPRADVVMIGHSLVDWSDDQRRTIIRNAYDAVQPGGAFLVWDPMIAGDDNDLDNTIRSLNFQLMTATGTNYRVEDCEQWMLDAGFELTSHVSLGHSVTLVTGRKAN